MYFTVNREIAQVPLLIWRAARLLFTTGCCTTLSRSTQTCPRQPCSMQCGGYNRTEPGVHLSRGKFNHSRGQRQDSQVYIRYSLLVRPVRRISLQRMLLPRQRTSLCAFRDACNAENKFTYAIVGARLHYCNSLFSDMAAKNRERFQGVQNCLARVVAVLIGLITSIRFLSNFTDNP